MEKLLAPLMDDVGHLDILLREVLTVLSGTPKSSRQTQHEQFFAEELLE